MQQSPLVGVELQPVAAAFRDAARELIAARQTVASSSSSGIGPAPAAAMVETGLRDLLGLLDRLEATATGCVEALARYGDPAPDPTGRP